MNDVKKIQATTIAFPLFISTFIQYSMTPYLKTKGTFSTLKYIACYPK